MIQPLAFNPRQSVAGLRRMRVEAQVLAEETHCSWCGNEVDQTLTAPHPWSAVVDQVQPLWLGGNPYDRSNNHLAHRACQATRTTRLRADG